ncbi:MAG: non-homologous end-joining DNA ligase [Candidatus Babeliales bacterium]
MNSLKVGRYKVAITHPERTLFPKSKITKEDLIEYYNDIASYMVPYLKDRPLTMHRYPEGITQEGFYQKDMPDYFPDFIKGKTIPKKEGGSTTYVVCNNAATLVYLANQACITPHVWLSKIDKLKYPDMLIFDMDPPSTTKKSFNLVRHAALSLKKILEDIGLVPFVKTTGSRGLHVVVPIKRTATFDAVRTCAQKIAQILIDNDPKHFTMEIRKEKRGNKVFIDTLRNAYAQTAVAPYAVRAKEKAPVATPIFWDEVEDATLTSQRYNIDNIFNYLKKHKDPWKNFFKSARDIKSACKKLKRSYGFQPSSRLRRTG